MAASAINTSVEMATKPRTEDYAVIEVHKEIKNDDGSVTKEISYTSISGEKKINEAKAKGLVKLEQTFSWPEANNDEGQKKVLRVEAARSRAFNAGVKSSLVDPRVRKLLTAVDENTGELEFEPVQGTYDLDAVINEPGQRPRMSADEKAVENLLQLYPDRTREEVMAILQMFKTGPATQNTEEEAEEEQEAEGEETTA